jgi:hypothetical protein
MKPDSRYTAPQIIADCRRMLVTIPPDVEDALRIMGEEIGSAALGRTLKRFEQEAVAAMARVLVKQVDSRILNIDMGLFDAENLVKGSPEASA